MEKNKYSNEYSNKKYNLLVDDMLYNIIVNLRNNNITFDEVAEELGITKEELIDSISQDKKDFFIELETISLLEEKGLYENHSRLNQNRRKR